jgi:hypothetical protein
LPPLEAEPLTEKFGDLQPIRLFGADEA